MSIIRKYKFPCDRWVLALTAIVIYFTIFALALIFFFFSEGGDYISAWFLSLVFFIVALYSLSIPRSMVLMEDKLEIRCLLKLVEIKKENIATVRRVPRSELRFIVPVMASFGFFGYYGLYFNLVRRRFVWIYAGEWTNFVQITEKHGTNVIVSVRDSRELISTLKV